LLRFRKFHSDDNDDFLLILDTRIEEKKSRGTLISAVERLISKDDLIIVDGMNYIKGFRYQLYCIARAVGTPHCVVCKEFNSHFLIVRESFNLGFDFL